MSGPPIGPLIGLLDSGLSGCDRVVAARRFVQQPCGDVSEHAAEPDPLGHGSVLAEIILRGLPSARLLSAQVFNARGLATPAVVAAGLSWLVEAGARVVNMSFGLTEDRPVLRHACQRAVERGVLVVASVPAIGPLVFPAAYPGVVRVTGDGRCSGAEIAAIASERTDFGASPWPGDGPTRKRPVVAGASVAAARVSAALAALVEHAGGAAQAVAALNAAASHHGPQRVPHG